MAALLADLDEELRARRWPADRVGVLRRRDAKSVQRRVNRASIARGQTSAAVLVPDAEITLEANPGAVERGRFADYAAAGVNRVSVGVQSFERTDWRRWVGFIRREKRRQRWKNCAAPASPTSTSI